MKTFIATALVALSLAAGAAQAKPAADLHDVIAAPFTANLTAQDILDHQLRFGN